MAEHGSSLYDILCAGEWRLAITSNEYLLNILLVGAGRMGQRHLVGISQLNSFCYI